MTKLSKKINYLILIVMLFLNSPASAMPNTKEILERLASESDKKYVSESYLIGVFEGFQWSNGALQNRGEKPLFCQPAKLALNFEQKIDILKKYLIVDSRMLDAPAGLAFLYAMRYTFPCAA
jgi:hypothetical protein